MAELGWKSVGVLELTALPSIARAVWVPGSRGRRPLVNGGDTIYLDRWMRESGLAELLPSLIVTWGSAPGAWSCRHASRTLRLWTRPVGGEGLGLVDFESSRSSTTPACRRTPAERSTGRPD